MAHLKKKEYEKAISDETEAIRLKPTDANAYLCRGLAYIDKKEYDQAIKDFTEGIRLNDRRSSGALAWLLATCPKDSLRDGKRAVELADKVCRGCDWKVAADLEILAAAYAECGKYDEAVKWQKRAIELDETIGNQRLKLYEHRKPYRDE